MSSKLNIVSSSIVILICIYILSKRAFVDNKFTCLNYVSNTYLYLILTIAILALSFFSIKNLENINVNPLITFLFTLSFLFATIYTQNIALKHVFWLGFIISISFILIPQIKSMMARGTFSSALMTTILILTVISIYVYYNPDSNLTQSWGHYLLWALIAGIIFQLIMILTNGFTPDRWNLMATIFVILFTLFLLYDTENLYKRAKTCGQMV